MSDAAIGPLAGYLFQFEKALLLLATLENATDVVSVELVDDAAIQDENGIVLLSVQSKHSISPSGTTFEDTSKALWRTIQIWLEKLESGIFNPNTQFICSTNKKIPSNALIRKIQENDFTAVVKEINDVLDTQKLKLKSCGKDAGASIKNTIKLIEFALSKPKEFEIIKNNIRVSDDESLMNKFFVAIHMTSPELAEVRKKATFEEMYGWITSSSKAKWLNARDATFSKMDFDTRLANANSNPSIVYAIFRQKSILGSISAREIEQAKKELFVAQIEDIKRNREAKERKIEAAIQDFLYHDIEMAHIVGKGNITDDDFQKFKADCKEKWQTCFDKHVINEIDEYSETEKNDISIKIFDTIMDDIQIDFQEGFKFTSSNKYIHNGTFLKLSNVPEIGWKPDWKSKYKANN